MKRLIRKIHFFATILSSSYHIRAPLSTCGQNDKKNLECSKCVLGGHSQLMLVVMLKSMTIIVEWK